MRVSLQSDEAVELLKDMFILQLGVAGATRRAIRAIVQCDNNRITRILRHIPRMNKEGEE